MTPSTKIKRAMEKSGYRVSQVAAYCEKDVRTVARWRSGETRPSQRDREMMASLFGCSPEELV